METRYVCQFSCGAASAVATKLTLAEFGAERVLIVNAFVVEEEADNRRFLADCEKWFGHPVSVLRDRKYGASTKNVWMKRQFIKGQRGAPCSEALKRSVLESVQMPGDVVVLGYTSEEDGRFQDIQKNFPEKRFKAPLIERGLSKNDCLTMVLRAGIEIPRMYRLGFDNANCIGCPKGGQAYWQWIRHHFPAEFEEIAVIQESIGPGAYFLRFRSGPRKEERMSLRELPEGLGDMGAEPGFSCSFFCAAAEYEYSEEVSR